ncbi:MAG: Holliday junction resolvase RecU [Thermovenabulum sp.]|uniref:Holliday junction resolvase RecU n=1 Tax=Thermovenabulum sp. TaxID=3100335 RepID=UPI003C7A54F4
MKSHANRGRLLEDLIIMANRQYRAQGRAIIHKIPTAWMPLRDGRGRIVNAKVEEKAAVDFLGAYKGRPIAFDAKHTYEERIRWDRIEPHQAEFLKEWQQTGGISFVLLGYSMERFFVVPWDYWEEGMRAWVYKKGEASISINQMKPEWEVKQKWGVVLDYLEVVDRVFAI